MQNVNKIRRFLAIAAALASLLVIATVTYRMKQEHPSKKGERKLPVQVDVSLQKFRYTETSHGVKRWDLSAERADYDKQRDMTTLTGVRLTIPQGKRTGELQVSADRADYNNATRDVVLTGNVHGVGQNGFEFSAPSVTYLAAKELLKSADRVRFKDEGLELEGVGMEFKTGTRSLRLMKDVTATYRPQEKR